MKKLRIIGLLASIICMISACTKKGGQLCHTQIRFKNVGHETIHAFTSFNYPDTTLFPIQATTSFLKQHNALLTGAGRTRHLERGNGDCWEYVFIENKELLSDTVMVAVYSDDFKLLTRLDLSLSDLRRINFTIMYSDSTPTTSKN